MFQMAATLCIVLFSSYTIATTQKNHHYKKRISLLQAKEKKVHTEFEKKNYKKVIEILEPISSEASESSLNILGTALEKLKKYEKSRKVFTSLLNKYPKKYIYHFRTGILSYAIYKKNKPEFYVQPKTYVGAKAKEAAKELNNEKEREQKSNQTQAITHLRQTIELNPYFEYAYRHLIKIFKEDENYYERQIILKRAIKNIGPKPSFLSQLCETYSKNGFLNLAIKTCKQAIEKDPKRQAQNSLYLSRNFKNKGDEKQAREILYAAAKKIKNSFEVQKEAGLQYFQEKNYRSANIAFKGAIKVASTNLSKISSQSDHSAKKNQVLKKKYILGDTHSLLAESLFESENYEEAFEHFIKACKIDSRHEPKILTSAIKLNQKNKLILSEKYRSASFKCFPEVKAN